MKILVQSAQLPILGFVILWLSLFAGFGYTSHSHFHLHSHGIYKRALDPALSSSKLNLYSHCYEKIWLWEIYQMIVTYDEADKQKLLLPYKKQKGQVGLNNKHFISDKKREGPLHYNELMVRLKGEWLDPKDPNFPSLTEPRSADDLERSAQELYDQKFKGLIDIESANPALQSKKAQDSDKAYQKLFTLLNNQLVEWHTKHSIDFLSAAESKEGVEGRFYSRNQRMTEIGKRVVKLRIADGQDYLVRMMSGDKKGELGLSEKVKTDSGEEKWQSTVRTVDAKTDVPGVPGYKSVDFVATYNDPKNNAKLKDKFPTVEDFSNWATDLGNPETKSTATDHPNNWAKGHESHFKTMSIWKKISAQKAC